MSIKDGAADVTENYNLTSTTAGKLTIVADETKPLAVESLSKEWSYDNTTHTYKTYTVTYGAETLTGTEGQTEFTLSTGDKVTVTPTEKGANGVLNVSDSGANSFIWTVENESSYVKGEDTVGTLTIKPRSITMTSATDSKVYDGKALTNSTVTVTGDGFADGEGATYNVTGSQTLVGNSENTFTYKLNDGTKAENYVINVVPGTLTVTDDTPDEPVKPDLVVTKSHTGSDFKLGDTVTFNITATNIYEEPQTITLSEIDGVKLAESVFENVKGGETIKTTATYTITEADILAQKFENTVTAKLGNIEKKATDTVTADELEDKNGHLTITKETTNEPANGKTYALGEKITYKITVLNDGNLTITNITVTDELTGGEWQIESLAPKASKEFETSYTVTEADILAGEVVNVATGKGDSPDPDEPDVPVDPGVDPEPTEEKNGHLTITKETTSKPADGVAYKLGEEITYKITVLNDGNLTITNIMVTDELTGDKWAIDSLEPGESKEFTAKYVVTEADVLKGEVLNVATGKGTSPDPDKPDVPVVPGEDPEPTEDKKGHITIEKETTSKPANGSKYVFGETITYKITVKNDGNLTVKDITVTDELTGDEWTIPSLAPGESKEFTAKYVVTAADVLKGEVVNVATGKGTSPDPDQPNVPVVPGEDPEPVDEAFGPVTIASATRSWTYDGTTHTEEVYTVTYDGTTVKADATGKVFTLPTGDRLTITATADGVKDYGAGYSRNNTFTYTLAHADHYTNVSVTYGTLRINKRQVTLTSGSSTKMFDGAALRNTKVTATGDGWVKGEGATYDAFPSITNVGTVANTFTYQLNAGTKADNYEITVVNGRLRVFVEEIPDEEVPLAFPGYLGNQTGECFE